ncbi:SDR family oxidoreductase [Paenibacillus terrigena]|uniref:SDR family oxidoreductase n=1 Tax=Paenibacillus terrigena TaxID=369333 RepID=UPI0003828168|nr:SDR family oxidoreductase [Paenibacillus terrigena]
MIAIIGATGTIGNELLRRLMELSVPVRALTREPDKLRQQMGDLGLSKVEICAADANDPESMRRALEGASQLFLALSNSPRQVELETSIIQIAAQEGIEHIVKISSPAYEKSSPVAVAGWHAEIEQALVASGLIYTVLRPYAFMQNLLRLAPTITTQDVFFGCIGDSPCNFIDCRDIADVAAVALTNQKPACGIYTLTGSETFTYPQIADKLSTLLNRPIRFINLKPEALRSDLIVHGHMPPWLAEHVVEIQTMSTAVPEKPTNTVQSLLGREPRTLDAFLQENRNSFQARR